MKVQEMIAIGLAVVIVGLSVVAVVFKFQHLSALNEAREYKSAFETMEAANTQNLKTLLVYRQAAEQNADLAKTFGARLDAIKNLDAEDRAKIKEVLANDPNARAWADAVVPDSVRNATTRH